LNILKTYCNNVIILSRITDSHSSSQLQKIDADKALVASNTFHLRRRMRYNADEAIGMTGTTTSRELGAKEAIEAIRGPLSNGQIMEQFKISPQGFADLVKQLFEKRLITQDDLNRRGIRFKVVKKQAPPQIIPPPPLAPTEDTEEFLDTITLTDMLTFKDPDEQPVQKKREPTEIASSEEEAEELSEKKSRFSLTGFFKKAK
jgi:hypothetical protein